MDIVTLSYSDAGGHHSIHLDRESTSIGRSQGQDIMLSDPCVSRQHALILREGDRYTIVDRSSTHGTFVNSVRVGRLVLQFNDIVQIGSLNAPRMRFHLRQSDETLTSRLPSTPAILNNLSGQFPSNRLLAQHTNLNRLVQGHRQYGEMTMPRQFHYCSVPGAAPSRFNFPLPGFVLPSPQLLRRKL